jgi:pyridoxamine 5'-phosphate oxidase
MHDARRTYEFARIDDADLVADPFAQTQAWLDEAFACEKLVEPHAMTLATVDAQGQPSARIVLLRGFDSRGLVFFTNYESRKGREIESTGFAAALLYWDVLERELRVEGPVERLTTRESDEYFAKRPRGHRLSAWASPQSRPVKSRAELEQAMHELETRFPQEDVPRPPYWGGYRIVPRLFEFWQGRRNRVHDRFEYRLVEEGWSISRLAP